MKAIIRWFAFWTFISITFVLSASYLYCYANGYRINWLSRKVQKTGLVTVSTSPDKAEVILDNEIKKTANARFTYVLPGIHTVEIKLAGYQPWSQNIEVQDGIANSLNAELVFEKPLVSDNSDKINFDQSSSLQIKNLSEIWDGSNLITRFSKNVLAICWDNDQNNIAYQIGDELRLITSDGLHDFFVAKLASDKPIKMVFKNNTSLIYSQSGLQEMIQIRDKNSLIPYSFNGLGL